MWWLEILFFSFGIALPIVLARWLEERYYEHHNVPGKTSMERIKHLLDLLSRDVVEPDYWGDRGDPLGRGPFEDREYRGGFANRLYTFITGEDRDAGPGNVVYMSLKDRPISINVKILSSLGVLVSWLFVLFGLLFFEGIGSFFDHWIWSIPVYLAFVGICFLFLVGFFTTAMDEPAGDLKEFPNVLLYTHLGGVGLLFLVFSITGLFGFNLLKWSEEIASDFAALLILMALGIFFLGGYSGWNTFQEEKRATKISHRLSMIDSSDSRRHSNLAALRARLEQDSGAPNFIEALEKAIKKQYGKRRDNILRGLEEKEIPTLKDVKETTSTKVPTYREVLMNYWVPLGRPKQSSEFTPWHAYQLETIIVDGTGGPKAHRKALARLQKRIIDPIHHEFEAQYLSCQTVDEVRNLIGLYERYADFPEVIERVTAGEAEEFVLIDLNMLQD